LGTGTVMIKILAPLIGAVMVAGSAHAAVTFTSQPFDPGVPAGQTIVEDFDTPIAAGYTFNFRRGATIETNSISGVAAAPAGDTTNFAAVVTNSFAYLTSPEALKSASIYLGSLDTYNYIGFFNDTNGKLTPIATFGGSQLVANPNGNQTGSATNRTFDFNFGNSDVNVIGFGSTGNSFEFDNIAVSAVPEPETWVLLTLGIAGAGLMLRRRRSSAICHPSHAPA
jgi:hypothetical protein